jgi:hypothetical protein
MRRVPASLITATLLLAWGCGRYSYELRLEATLARMKYRQRLDQFLGPPPSDAKFQELQVFLRPPKGMDLTKEFVMAAVTPGAYDLLASFVGQSQGSSRSLHLLARRKTAKKAAGKAAPTPEPAVERGPFEQDVVTLLAGVYGANEALQQPNFQTDKKGGNSFRRLTFKASNNNDVWVYFYKKEPHEVALVWDLPPDAAKDNALRTARDLCLQSFAVGERARAAFGGDISEEGAPAGPAGPGGATPF